MDRVSLAAFTSVQGMGKFMFRGCGKLVLVASILATIFSGVVRDAGYPVVEPFSTQSQDIVRAYQDKPFASIVDLDDVSEEVANAMFSSAYKGHIVIIVIPGSPGEI